MWWEVHVSEENVVGLCRLDPMLESWLGSVVTVINLLHSVQCTRQGFSVLLQVDNIHIHVHVHTLHYHCSILYKVNHNWMTLYFSCIGKAGINIRSCFLSAVVFRKMSDQSGAKTRKLSILISIPGLSS